MAITAGEKPKPDSLNELEQEVRQELANLNLDDDGPELKEFNKKRERALRVIDPDD